MTSQNKAGFQLSPQQKRLWLLGQSFEGAPYFVQCGLAIDGNLDSEILKDSIQGIVDRHEILRTTFRRQPGFKTPFQFISESTTPLWRYIDLSGVETSQQEARIEEAFKSEGNRSFDFENDSPLRLVLITQSATKRVLIMTLPAICADSLTMRNLVREVTESYGSDELLSEPQMQYADYSQWQNDLLESEDEEAELGREFWLKQESSPTPILRLPFEREYDEQNKSGAPGRLSVDINNDLIAELGANTNDSALASTYFLVCWQILLRRVTGQPEFVVNVGCDGRDHEEVQGAFGLYAKSLPVRCSFGTDRRFEEVVEQVRESLDNAYEWQAFFNPVKDAASSETIGFEFYDGLSKQEVKGLTFSIFQQYTFTYPSRLKLCCVRSGSSVAAELHYDPALFQRATIERIARHFETLLESAIKRPEARVSELAILSEAEQRQLLVALNETGRTYPDECIHELFEKQVSKTPDATALVFDDQKLSYVELNARANRLAHLLLSRGLEANAAVGLCVERSLEMIIGLLGILKAGHAYVPLNPEQPKTRLSRQLADARVPLVVTQEKLAQHLPEFEGEVLCLDNQRLFDGEATTNPKTDITPESLVYILYTSGSTGIPKGVAVRHQNLANYTQFICERLKLKESGSLQFASVSTITADLGNTCIFPSLVTGGCLHIVKYEVAMAGSRFADYLKDHPIDVLKIVPSHLSSLLETAGSENCLPRKYLVLGGDILSWELAERVSRMNEGCEVINHYGPTETTVGSLTFSLRGNGASIDQTVQVPIGRPIANTQIYILDAELNPVPIGVAGQLCISGAGVAQGYLNQPEETAKRFIVNPFSTFESRLYMTGDLARYLPDGNVEFLGRIDNQVKIRGYRVELGEIEAILQQHPQVKQGLVVSRDGEPGEKKLVAYVVAGRGQSPTVSELRAHLSDQLPDYMVPGSYVFLNALPLTSNGKIDRGALPDPEVLRPELDRGYMAPRTPVEEIMAGIWAKLLKLDHVGIHDNFFELGGHSLLATQVISRTRETLRVELPLSSLFEAPTVAGLTQAIEETRRAIHGVQAPPVARASRKIELPLSFAQQRLWLLDQLEPGNVNYNVPRAIRLRGLLNRSALQRTLDNLVARHESLRTTFAVADGRPLQVIAVSGSIPLVSLDLIDLPEHQRSEELERLSNNEARQPFDLARGPLLRAILVRLDREDHILLLTNHHIVSDGWSGGILFQEFAILYKAFAMGQPSPLEELPVQYADYAVWQREQLQGEVLARELNYWKQQLEDAPPLLELPLDRPRPTVQTHRGESKNLILPASLVKALRALSQREGATLFMTLLASFQLLLSRYSGQEDISVGSPIAGRTHAEIEKLVGFFVNTLVLRTRLSGDPTFRELLVRVREVALGAFAHQEIPFEKLIEELHPERNLSHQPLFQVFFNVQNLNMLNFSGDRIELPGLAVEHLPSSDIGSKFDLTLYVIERDDDVQLELLYNADLFNPERMEEMLEQFKCLLEETVKDPDNRISQFSTVTPGAKQFLPDPTQALQAGSAVPIQKLFSQQARKNPEHLAVVYKKESLSYHELDTRSNQLANYLRGNGIQSQDVVAVYGHRSASLVLALLGVLKAGASFLILDPAYPVTRLIRCLKMASPRGWIQMEAEGPVPGALDEFVNTLGCRCRVQLQVSVGEDDLLSSYSTEDPDIPVNPDDLAYVAFTSGSTGTPKGILGRHQSLTHFGYWAREMFELGPSDRFSMLSGLSHDPLHRDIFTALQFGATICIPDANDLGDPSSLLAWMNQQTISIANLTPAMAQLMTQTTPTENGCEIQSLRYAFLVGDVLTKRDVARLEKVAPSVTCVNLYGATETHFALGYFIVPQTERSFDGKEVLPLGRGIKDVQLLLLNASQGRAGIGEVAEIYVRSPHLAKGYLGDDALTRERFVVNPFTKADDDRLYRSGDLGRYLPDGNVEFLGRLDRQVKIRGFRIELREVEAALSEHPEVRETAVIIREKDLSEKSLVAYVVPTQNSTIANTELRRHLREKLPEYMVPAAIVMLEALPLTPNGKVDHAALPAPDTSASFMERTFVGPQTPAEEVIAAIWEELLGLEKVSVHENFFDLGGHSLLATQVISRVRDSFHLDLPLRALFESPTVAGLALSIAQRQARNAEPEEMKRILAELNELSDEESQQLLNTEMQ